MICGSGIGRRGGGSVMHGERAAEHLPVADALRLHLHGGGRPELGGRPPVRLAAGRGAAVRPKHPGAGGPGPGALAVRGGGRAGGRVHHNHCRDQHQDHTL
jgi:hypothetical protein